MPNVWGAAGRTGVKDDLTGPAGRVNARRREVEFLWKLRHQSRRVLVVEV
jgi:hypothetical protein